MAEQEIIKHTKKVYKLWSSDEHSFWYKLREFAIEIFIIVFAVTISIWLHSWSEHRSEQKDVKEFLLGLRKDLTSDIKEMKEDVASFEKQGQAFRYIASRSSAAPIAPDSLNKYGNSILNNTGLVPNNGRFEGFKSSGKMGRIENYELQNDIMDLYQENIPSLLNSTNHYTEIKKELWQYLRVHTTKLVGPNSDISTVLVQPEALNTSVLLANPVQAIERYRACIAKMNKIIKQIDSTYGNTER